MPELCVLVPWVIFKIEIGGAVKTAIRQFEPNRLIHPDTIATHSAPQKPRRLTHPKPAFVLEEARTLRRPARMRERVYSLLDAEDYGPKSGSGLRDIIECAGGHPA